MLMSRVGDPLRRSTDESALRTLYYIPRMADTEALPHAPHDPCDYCSSTLYSDQSCTKKTYDDFVGVAPLDRLPFHGELPESHCLRCGTPNGGLHHFGCSEEVCPLCNEEQLYCDCPVFSRVC